MLNRLKQTAKERAAGIDGIGLFFGALLGANLGSLSEMSVNDYAVIVMLLAGAVVTIQTVVRSERRLYAAMVLALYVLIFASILLLPTLRPEGVPTVDLHKLLITLAIWIGLVVFFEYWPVSEPAKGADS
jgi:drug/metabolite transporter (DMT)-like permease